MTFSLVESKITVHIMTGIKIILFRLKRRKLPTRNIEKPSVKAMALT